MRTIVELPEDQIKGLKDLAETTHLSRAELMRRAVSEYLAKYKHNENEEAFGLWSKNKLNAIDHQQQMRSEWDK